MTTSTSAKVYSLIEQIAQASGRNAKIDILKKVLDVRDQNPVAGMFAMTLLDAYEPGIVYNIEQKTLDTLPPATVQAAPGNRGFNDGTRLLLQALQRSASDLNLQILSNELFELDAQSGELLKRILLRDLRAGIAEGTINAACPGFVTTFGYMRCSLPPKSNIGKFDWAKGVFSQVKADGMFVNINRRNGISFFSRQGSRFPARSLGPVEDIALSVFPDGTQTHGELLVVDGNGKILPREQSNGMLNSVLKGGALEPGHHVALEVWDQIPLTAVDAGKCDEPYVKRFATLNNQMAVVGEQLARIRMIETRIVKNHDQAMAHYKDCLARGLEGTVVKSPTTIWKNGTSKDQVKLKLEVQVELEVCGFNAGTGKYANTLGALSCRSRCGLLQVDVNGRTDAMRDEVWNDQAGWTGSVVTVKGNAIMKPTKEGDPHSLFLPVFVERRHDKDQADSLDEIKAQFEAAVAA